ncbi:hypothetical protein M404DRAFT_1001957 [Pisolithus tinctorius Marx 270]|uniref:Uncharacterized protein n=1 Tax=Pisolithus tinctorius Marx 270 TaxID=870435 RepID=A0A0C3J0Y7_PISTI|nr:hypothetical protein M404DRAFT_1001957 [Pisolithus tinctorius Marx 270]
MAWRNEVMAVKLSEDAIPGVGDHWADRDRSGSSRSKNIIKIDRKKGDQNLANTIE